MTPPTKKTKKKKTKKKKNNNNNNKKTKTKTKQKLFLSLILCSEKPAKVNSLKVIFSLGTESVGSGSGNTRRCTCVRFYLTIYNTLPAADLTTRQVLYHLSLPPSSAFGDISLSRPDLSHSLNPHPFAFAFSPTLSHSLSISPLSHCLSLPLSHCLSLPLSHWLSQCLIQSLPLSLSFTHSLPLSL